MSDMQELITDSARRLLGELSTREAIARMEGGGWDPESWSTITASGFVDVLVEEAGEAAGDHWSRTYPVLHAIGLKSLPFPLAEALLCRGIAATAGLAGADGLVTLAVQDRELQLELSPNGRLTVDGRLPEVPWARCADHLLVAGRVADQDVLALVGLRGDHVQLAQGANIAGEPRDDVTLRSAKAVEWIAGSGFATGALLRHLALVRSAMMVGAAEAALELAVRYSGERRQFGRALSQFQAIQQMLAMLAGEVTAAKTITRAAFASAQREPQAFDVAVAKVRAGRVAEAAASIAHQVHGAIGFAREHPLHLHTRRLWSWRAEAGAESYWAECIGREAIARGGHQFWADLTASQTARA